MIPFQVGPRNQIAVVCHLALRHPPLRQPWQVTVYRKLEMIVDLFWRTAYLEEPGVKSVAVGRKLDGLSAFGLAPISFNQVSLHLSSKAT